MVEERASRNDQNARTVSFEKYVPARIKISYENIVEREHFEELVNQAIDSLPDKFKKSLNNIDVLVQDWPSQQQLESVGMKRRQDLFGLYEGIPLTKRTRGYNMVLPDKITIFQKPIEMRYRSDETIKKKIQSTVRHEIAHHFGISDARLREIGRY